MRKGFTIIELLVASVLLGLLVTILTMVFNQSSIAWRTGQAVTAGMDRVRDNIAEIREEADNAFLYNGQVYRTVGLWRTDGRLRDRACDAPGSQVQSEHGTRPEMVRSPVQSLNGRPWSDSTSLRNVDGADSSARRKNYTVNVRSKGPRNDERDWQAIYSFPDDPEEWCK